MPSKAIQMLKDVFTKNRELKLLAVLLAILSFYTIRGATSYEVPYVVPLEVRVEQGEGLAILDQEPRSVEITFRGSREDLGRLDTTRIKAVVKPKGINPTGSEVLAVGAGDIVGAPPGVRAVYIRPASVTVMFDREASKEVAVIRPAIVGKPLLGKVEIDYEPRFVTIRGPTRRLKDKAAVVTESVDVDGRVESFTKRVRIIPPGDAWVSAIEPSEITVRVMIVTETVSREWNHVPVLALVPPQEACAVRFDPPTVTVSLHGRAEMLDAIVPENVKVFVDAMGLDAAASYELPVNVFLPGGIAVSASAEPETVKVVFGMAADEAAGTTP